MCGSSDLFNVSHISKGEDGEVKLLHRFPFASKREKTSQGSILQEYSSFLNRSPKPSALYVTLLRITSIFHSARIRTMGKDFIFQKIIANALEEFLFSVWFQLYVFFPFYINLHAFLLDELSICERCKIIDSNRK